MMHLVALAMLIVYDVTGMSLANPIVPPEPLAKSQPQQKGDCVKYILEGKGDYKLQRKLHPVQNHDYVIESLRLVRRTSFYKCEPQSVKYGTGVEGRIWWVDKGCEGIFEVTECPSTTKAIHPETWSGIVHEDVILQMRPNLARSPDLKKWNFNGVENRFEIRQ